MHVASGPINKTDLLHTQIKEKPVQYESLRL